MLKFPDDPYNAWYPEHVFVSTPYLRLYLAYRPCWELERICGVWHGGGDDVLQQPFEHLHIFITTKVNASGQ